MKRVKKARRVFFIALISINVIMLSGCKHVYEEPGIGIIGGAEVPARLFVGTMILNELIDRFFIRYVVYIAFAALAAIVLLIIRLALKIRRSKKD